ncbi:putative membrane protein YkvI [Caldicellulosiruptor bescii]|uniref:Uncharacterized membrane protein n=2 Tax=Caldicellulosiruptor bescii TaxID=31899 RepID=B9MKS0_CALBD|nr:hypothetical protein [Caldicellulosiruptor bescii]ACM60928.1 uncharacterized membrane protein [Caldicellulosiruptor bescii DSM 6725]PBC89253.1 putative membrane protein YkvI [Caldicellulosiruptor bescii]PBC91262.1 putative membrane protein YkvI [Caldicellulosiruptor bescii]PBD03324.1 putative membrane protein YkvI [Caldicellulosiruptor bescii]PBD07061.1 putative membrane protein YkvI [Caldicellulosiruptor bescii]
MGRIFAIISSVLGSIIGAGFSTGQEVFYFFSQFKETSIFYISLSSILIFLILLYLINIKIKNRIILIIFKSYILLFSIITLIVMFSAFGQLGEEFLGVSRYIFTLLCFVLSIAIFKHGLLAVININKVVVSILTTTVILIFLRSVHKNEIVFQFESLKCTLPKNISQHLIFPLLYSTYNSLLAFPVINGLKERFHKEEIKISIVISSILIFLLLSIINTILLSKSSTQTSQMPLLKVEKSIILQFILVTCAFLEILTTVLANYMGLCYSIKNSKAEFVIIIISLLLGFNQFQVLLRKLYSLMGYIGLGIIAMLSLSTLLLKDRRLK